MTQQTHQTTITKDLANKRIIVVREFDGTLEEVWKAWTESEWLDKWWAPRPWKAITKEMNFTEGGHWLYYMAGPNDEKQFCRVDYKTIQPEKSFTAVDAFCDENGNDISGFPNMHWKNTFTKTETGTEVTVEITFKTEEDLNKIIEMGFKEGFTMAHSNLDELLAK